MTGPKDVGALQRHKSVNRSKKSNSRQKKITWKKYEFDLKKLSEQESGTQNQKSKEVYKPVISPNLREGSSVNDTLREHEENNIRILKSSFDGLEHSD